MAVPHFDGRPDRPPRQRPARRVHRAASRTLEQSPSPPSPHLPSFALAPRPPGAGQASRGKNRDRNGTARAPRSPSWHSPSAPLHPRPGGRRGGWRGGLSVGAHGLGNWSHRSVQLTIGEAHYVRERLFQGLPGLQQAGAARAMASGSGEVRPLGSSPRRRARRRPRGPAPRKPAARRSNSGCGPARGRCSPPRRGSERRC